MPARIKDDRIVFSSGRTACANDGIVGLSQDLEITHGYDGRFKWPPDQLQNEEARLSADDMRELADLMIEQWTRFRTSLPPSS